MSNHAQVVRDYIALRNYLAKSNPRPDMEFEIHFKIEGSSLLAFNTSTGAKAELTKVQPQYFNIYLPQYGCLFESYSRDLMVFINGNLNVKEGDDIKGKIVSLAHKHKRSLGLGNAYEPPS